MTEKRISLLLTLTAATFVLFALSAFIPRFAAEEEIYKPSAQGYQNIESQSQMGKMKISGCLPQDEMAGYFNKSLEGFVSDISVFADEDILTVKGQLGDTDRLKEKFPQIGELSLLADVVADANATVKIKLIYDEEKGFSADINEAKIENLSLPTDIFFDITTELANNLNERIKDKVDVHYWQLRDGGLYYSVTLTEQNDLKLIYPIQ